MENKLLTVKDVAGYLRLSEQTIQRYVLSREIPFHKVKKVIRFRLAEIERWVDAGGGKCAAREGEEQGGDLFAGDYGASGADGEEQA
jgi:excisionase family DNA binding protein